MKEAIEIVKDMLRQNKFNPLASISETIYTEAVLEDVLKTLQEAERVKNATSD